MKPFPFELLSPLTQMRLYYQRSPRVPQGWIPHDPRPAPPPPKTKKPRLLTPWDQLTASTKLKLVARKSPRVPADVNIAEIRAQLTHTRVTTPNPTRLKTTKPVKDWDSLSLGSQKDLYYQGSPRVPIGWTPPGPSRQVKDWNSLTHSAKMYLYHRKSTRVPEDWDPPGQERSLVPGLRHGEIPEELQGLEGTELITALKIYLSRQINRSPRHRLTRDHLVSRKDPHDEEDNED